MDRRRALITGAAAITGAMLAPQASSAPAAAIFAEDFRTRGADDREVLRAAFAAWVRSPGTSLFLAPGRTYDVGVVSDGPDLFALSGLRKAILEGANARIVARSHPGLAWNLLSFSNVAGLTLRNISFADSGYVGETYGMKAIVVQPGIAGSSGIVLEGVSARRALSMVQCQGPSGPARVADLTFGANCRAEECYYALCCQDQGDAIHGDLAAENCRRAYLVYGVSDHVLNLTVFHGGPRAAPASRSPVLIKTYGRTTSDIALAVSFAGSLPWSGRGADDRGACVSIESQAGDRASLIENIRIDVSIEDGIDDLANPYLLALQSYSTSGSVERRTAGRWRNISVNLVRGAPREVVARSNPAERGTVQLLGNARVAAGEPARSNVLFVR